MAKPNLKPGCLLLIFLIFQFNLAVGQSPTRIQWDLEKIPQVGTVKSSQIPANRIYDFALDDFDKDGLPEIAVLRRDMNHPHFLVVTEVEADKYTFRGIPIPAGPNKIYRIPGHPIYKWLTYHPDSTKGVFWLYNHRLQLIDSLQTLNVSGQADSVWDGHIATQINLIDCNDDGRQDLLVPFTSGVEARPRTLLIYDLQTKQPLVEKRFAPMIKGGVRVADLDADGSPEIILALGGASEGPFFGEYKRDHSYLVILNHDGSLKRFWEFGGESTYIYFNLADLNGDFKPDILISFYSNFANSTSWLKLIDGATLKVLTTLNAPKVLSAFRFHHFIDLNHDGQPEILINNRKKGTAILNYYARTRSFTLNKVAKIPHKTSFLSNDDLNQDRNEELIFYCPEDASLLITDHKLRPLGRVPVQSQKNWCRPQFAKMDAFDLKKRDYWLLSADKLQHISITVDDLFPPPFLRIQGSGLKFDLSSGWFAGGLLFLSIFLFLSLVWAAKKLRPGAGVVLPESNRMGALLLDRNGIIIDQNQTLVTMLNLPEQFGSNLRISKVLNSGHLISLFKIIQQFIENRSDYFHNEINLGHPGRRKNLEVELIRIKTTADKPKILLLVIDASGAQLTDQIKIWTAMAQRVTHTIKTPLATVLLAIQRLQRKYRQNSPEFTEDYDALTKTAIDEIERVRGTINAFMKFANLGHPVLTNTDLNDVLEAAIQQYRYRLPGDVTLKIKAEKLPLPVKMDEKHFAEALYNLLDNAVTAIEGNGKISITTLLESHPLNHFGGSNHALIEISDTGKGISPEALSQLFTPGFTTTESGTGMGLVIAKNIIETHQGEIQVSSKENIGTTVFVRLPLAETN